MSSLTSEQYLEKYNIVEYLEDAINQLLEYKDEAPKISPARFLSEYFMSVHKGTNILFREYKYINSTLANRACFISCVLRCFRNIAKHGELLSVKEYHSMLCLLCPDFPLDVIQHTARIVLMEDALDCLMSFTDFLYAFQIQFYYEEFVNICKEIYDHLIAGFSTVVVPSPDTWERSKGSTEHTDTRIQVGVQSQIFYEAIEKARSKTAVNSPDKNYVFKELMKTPKVTFYGFLMNLSRNENISIEIGVLPSKDNIFNGAN